MTTSRPENRRLESWKEIAAYFGRTDRTVRRWEAELGLPVRRTPGQRQSRVHAEVAELEAWRRGADAIAVEVSLSESDEVATHGVLDAPEPALAEARLGGRGWKSYALAVAGAAVALLSVWIGVMRESNPPAISPSTRPPTLAAERLYVAGMDDFATRTPASLNRAVDEFRGATARDPRYAEAWAGLAQTYDLLREYTRMPASQAYGLAREAAMHALALDERQASAHAALGFADYFGFWDAAGGEAQFERALALDPGNATAHHWYATLLLQRGRYGEALRQIDAAGALEPRSAAIAADRALVLHRLGRSDEAVAILRSLENSHPAFMSPPQYLAAIAFDRGRWPAFLSELRVSTHLAGDRSQDADLAAAGRALASAGRTAMIASLLASAEKRYQGGAEDAYSVAVLAAWAGERAVALHFLGLSADRHEARLGYAPKDPAFVSLGRDPTFLALIARFGPQAS